MRPLLLVVLVSVLTACVGREFQSQPTIAPPALHDTRIESAPKGYYLRVECLDANGDGTVDASDLTPANVGDINLDGAIDERDASAFAEYELEVRGYLDCSTNDPHFLSTPPQGEPEECGSNPFVVVIGISGASEFGLDREDVAVGVRQILSKMQQQWGTFRTAVLLSSAEVSAAGNNKNRVIEQWLSAVIRSIAERHDCAVFVLVGHSHGATVAGAVAAELEAELGKKLALVVILDRIIERYDNPEAPVPSTAKVLNYFQQNDPVPPKNGQPLQQPNVTDKDVSEYPLDRVACPDALPEQQFVFHECVDTDLTVQADVLTTSNALVEQLRGTR